LSLAHFVLFCCSLRRFLIFSFIKFISDSIDFFDAIDELQAKVALVLLKFELLLSASKDFVKVVLSSSKEGIPF
jgi:hypothetical protein